METRVRVLIVDDHLVVRKGLFQVFEKSPNIHIVGEAQDGKEAFHLTQKLKPDVVIMDVQLEGISGVDTTRLIKELDIGISVIGLSSYADGITVQAMVAAGADGFLHKSVSGDELRDTVHKVASGHVLPMAQDLLTKAVNAAPDRTDESNSIRSEFGDQQQKVLSLLTKGFTNPEIARKLGVSVPTARYHVSAIFQKLNVTSRAEAVAIAIRDNLVSSAETEI